MKRRSTLVSTITNDPKPGAYMRESPVRGEYVESKCNACCKTPGYGCARNYMCPCHLKTETKEQ